MTGLRRGSMEKQTIVEKEKYDVVWRDYPCYRDCSPGEDFVPFFFEGFKGQIRAGQTITDFGCGTARVAKEFVAKGLHVSLVDISPYCLDQDIRNMLTLFSHQIEFHQGCLWHLSDAIKSTYWIYCCDVLEHIPEEKIDLVLEQLSRRMRHGGYFSICLKEDLAGKKLGHPLHLNVKGREYWEEKLSTYFKIVGVDAIADDLYFNARVALRHKP